MTRDRCYVLPSGVVVRGPHPPSDELAKAIAVIVRALEETEERRRNRLTPAERAAEDARREAGRERLRRLQTGR